MDWQNLLINSLSAFIASVPVSTIVTYILSSIKNKTGSFNTLLTDGISKINKTLEKFKTDITDKIVEKLGINESKIQNSLLSFEDLITPEINELKNIVSIYADKFDKMADANSVLAQENSAYLDVICSLIGTDTKLLKSGVAKTINYKVGLTKSELDNFQGTLEGDSNVLVSAISKAITVLGQDNFNNILIKAGYNFDTKKIDVSLVTGDDENENKQDA